MSSKELRIRYTGDITGVKSALGQIDQVHSSLGAKLKNLGSSFVSTGRSLTTGLTLPLVGLGALAAREFTEVVQVNAQTEAALKSTGGAANLTMADIHALSASIGKLSAQDAELVQAGENVLLTFTSVRNEVGKGNDIFNRASLAAADLSARMGTDLQSAMLLVGKAVNDPIKGMTALTRAGVQFTDSQKEQVAALVESGDLMGAQKIILAELQTQFGGSAKAAGDAASPVTKLMLAFNDLAEGIGQFVVPILEKVAGFFQGLADGFANLDPGMQQLIVTVGGVLAVLGPLLLIVGKLIGVLGSVVTAVKAVSSALAANPYIALIAVTIALVALIIANWDRIKAFLLGVWDRIKEVASTVWNAIKEAVLAPIRAGSEAISTVWNGIKEFISGVWDKIKEVASNIWGGIKEVIGDAIGAVKEKIGDFLGAIKETWREIWSGVKEFFSGIWDDIVRIAKEAMNLVIGFINTIIRGLNALLEAIDFALGPFINFPSLPPIPTLAEGGRIMGSGLAVVGERGPELLGLPRGAAVMPLPAGGGGGVSVTVIVQGSVIAERDLARTVRDELVKLQRRNINTGIV